MPPAHHEALMNRAWIEYKARAERFDFSSVRGGGPRSKIKKIIKKKPTITERREAYQDQARRFAKQIKIAPSRIDGANAGVFYTGTDPLPRGYVVGFYRGPKTEKLKGQQYYRWTDGRDAYDPEGQLRLNDGTRVEKGTIHNFTRADWGRLAEKGQYGTAWESKTNPPVNWTRYINHAEGTNSLGHSRANISVASDSQTYGMAGALYLKRRLAPGEELFYSYGNDYFPEGTVLTHPPTPPPSPVRL